MRLTTRVKPRTKLTSYKTYPGYGCTVTVLTLRFRFICMKMETSKWHWRAPFWVHCCRANGFGWIFFLGIEEPLLSPILIMLPLLSSSLRSMNYFYLTACHIHYQGNLVGMWMILHGLNFCYGYEELKINLDFAILNNKFTYPMNLAGSVASLSPGSIILCVLYKLS